MEEPAQALLDGGASRVVAWERPPASSSSEGATVLFSSFSPAPTDDELSALEMLFEDREAAIRSGMGLEGKRFEVRQKGERGKRNRKEREKKLVRRLFFSKSSTEKKRDIQNRSTATTRRWSTAARWARSPRTQRGRPSAALNGEQEEKEGKELRQLRRRRRTNGEEEEEEEEERRLKKSASQRSLTGSRTSPRGWCRCCRGFAARSSELERELEEEEEEQEGEGPGRRRLLSPAEARPEGRQREREKKQREREKKQRERERAVIPLSPSLLFFHLFPDVK